MYNWKDAKCKPDKMIDVDLMYKDLNGSKKLSLAHVNDNGNWEINANGNIIEDTNTVAWKETTVYFW